jgi:GNAT superfamily N-acetyltransferase
MQAEVAQCLRDKIQECDADSSAILVATPSACGQGGPAVGVIEVALDSRTDVLQAISRLQMKQGARGGSQNGQKSSHHKNFKSERDSESLEGQQGPLAPAGLTHGWLSSIAVSSQHRRQGCGTALMRESERLLCLWGCAWAALRADCKNPVALQLYEGCGWLVASEPHRATLLPWSMQTVLMVKRPSPEPRR